MLRVVVLCICICAMASNAIAHNVKIATYTLRDTGSGWFIEMNFAQAAIDAVMIKEFGDAEVAKLSTDEYKTLFLTYLDDHFKMKVDGKRIYFETGGILLDSHQTDVKYVLPEIPANPETIDVYLPMFEHVYNQTNLFRIYRGGGTFTKFFLSSDNDFSVKIEFDGDQIYGVYPDQNDLQISTFAGLLVGLSLVLMIVLKLKARSKNPQLSKA